MTSHLCDDSCVCPLHETQLYYAPSINDHACQDITCVFAHGMRSRQPKSLSDMISKMPASAFEQTPVRAQLHPRDPEVWPVGD